LMDIIEQPLAIRIRMTVSSGSSLFPMLVRAEETIVEVVN
jgi:hypothetical protein